MIELILLGILALRPDWRPDACDHPFATDGAKAACEARIVEGQAWAREIASAVAAETERQGMVPVWDWVVADIKREYDFSRGDVCPIRIPVENIISRVVLDEDDGREKICWSYTVHQDAPAGRNCQPVLVDREEEVDGRAYLYGDRCAYGETGLMQIRPHEARAGQVVPATGEPLPRSGDARRRLLLEPETNISLGLVALDGARTMCCCEETDDGMQTCDPACTADPAAWIGAYNSGRCTGDAAERYVAKLERLREEIAEYVCAERPEIFVGLDVPNLCEPAPAE